MPLRRDAGKDAAPPPAALPAGVRLVVSRPLAPSRSIVTDRDEVRHYWGSFLGHWSGGRRDAFPGCNPLSLSRRALADSLARHEYWLTLKSDGIRYALYCTVRPGSTPQRPLPVALMVDRSRNMYEVDVIAPEDVFTGGTLLEGELVWKGADGAEEGSGAPQEAMLFLVFDCIRSRGRSLVHLPFGERFAEAERSVRLSEELAALPDVETRAAETDHIVLMQYAPRIAMRAKVFVAREHADRLWQGRNEAGHRVDGLILQRRDAPYKLGIASDGSAYKWKERSTIDLAGEDLRTSDGPLPRTMEGRPVVCAAEESRIRVAGAHDVIEYLLAVEDGRITLFPLRRRLDKTTPNSLHCCRSTVRDVLEGIRPEEIARCGAAPSPPPPKAFSSV